VVVVSMIELGSGDSSSGSRHSTNINICVININNIMIRTNYY